MVFLVARRASCSSRSSAACIRASGSPSFFGIGLLALYGVAPVALRHGAALDAARAGSTAAPSIVGGGDPGEALIDALERQSDSDVRLLGVFDDRGDDRAPNACAGLPKLGTVDDLVEFARRTRVDLVIFSLPISAESRILQMLKKLWVLPVDIRLSAHTNKLRFRPRSYSYIGNGAGARRVRPADRRLGRRDEMAVRQGRRRPRAARRSRR